MNIVHALTEPKRQEKEGIKIIKSNNSFLNCKMLSMKCVMSLTFKQDNFYTGRMPISFNHNCLFFIFTKLIWTSLVFLIQTSPNASVQIVQNNNSALKRHTVFFEQLCL